MPSICDTAIFLAREGLPVLPLYGPDKGEKHERGKRPRQARWETRANTSEEILRWFQWYPDSNLGLICGAMSGLVCVDIDPRNGGQAWFDQHRAQLAGGVIEYTGSGGLHIWFRHPGGFVVSHTGKHGLAPGVELKADGGHQVVITPSLHPCGKPYACESDFVAIREFADVLPDWIATPMAAPEKRDQRPEVYADNAADLAVCRERLMAVPPAVEGAGGDHQTFVACCLGRDHDLSEAAFLPLIMEWNKRCSPPWDHDALVEKLRNAYRYAKAVAPGAASPSKDFTAVDPLAMPVAKSIAIRTHADRLRDRLQPRPQLVAGMLPADGVGAIVAMPGEGKSLVAAELARCVASGVAFHRHAVLPGRVLFACPDSPASTERRLLAIPEPACHRVLTVPDLPPLPGSLGQIRAALESYRDDPVRLLVVDTFDAAREHQTDGGWQGQDGLVEAIVGGLRRLASDFQCAVLIAHHATRSDNGRARGSVVFDARCDFIGLVSQVGGNIALDARKNRDGDRGPIGAWVISPVTINGATVPTLVEADVASLANGPEDQQARLLELIGATPGISKRALASGANIPVGSIGRHLQRLRDGGFIQAGDNILTDAGRQALKADPFLSQLGVDRGVDHDPPVIQ